MSLPLSPRTGGLAAVAVAALLLAACSGPDDPGTGGAGGSSSSSEDGTAPRLGPLDEYSVRIYGYEVTPSAQDEQRLRDEQQREMQRIEELVAACMQEEGFEYPVHTVEVAAPSADDGLDVEWGSLAFAQQYGYGLSTDPLGRGDDADRPDPTPEDPNAELLATMSESEAAAFQETLWGQNTPEGEEYDWTTAGCYGAAQHQVLEVDAATTPEQFADLEVEMNGYWEGVRTSPELAELNASWASCLADAGFDGFTDPVAAQSALAGEWDGLQGGGDAEYQALMDSWDFDAHPDGPPPSEPDPAAVADFTAREIAVAVADATCQESVAYAETLTALDHAAQQEFVDAHRAELDAWAEAATAAREG